MQILNWVKSILPPAIKEILKDVLGRNTFKSYSQFGEDAYLNSYFRGKTWQEGKVMLLQRQGVYVDIGAYSPTECSNTHAFYRRGWRGINIDATPGVMDSFKYVRRRDINLNIAIGSGNNELVFYSWGSPSVYNTANAELARERANVLGKDPVEISVSCMTLDLILDRYLEKGTKIDFMSVDVEGLDLDVLKSNNWDKYRPEVIIAEVYNENPEQLFSSELVSYMRDQDYMIIAWLNPSVIFRDCHTDIADV